MTSRAQAAALASAAYRLPPGHGPSASSTGGGGADYPSRIRRPMFSGSFINMALSAWKAFHYQEKTNIPGRTYSAYEPPRAFSTWLR